MKTQAPDFTSHGATQAEAMEISRLLAAGKVEEATARAAAMTEALEFPAKVRAEFQDLLNPAGSVICALGGYGSRAYISVDLKRATHEVDGSQRLYNVAEAFAMLEIIATNHPTAELVNMARVRHRGTLSFIPLPYAKTKFPEVEQLDEIDDKRDHMVSISPIICKVDRVAEYPSTATVQGFFQLGPDLIKIEAVTQAGDVMIAGRRIFGRHGCSGIEGQELVNKSGYFSRSVTYASGGHDMFSQRVLFDL